MKLERIILLSLSFIVFVSCSIPNKDINNSKENSEWLSNAKLDAHETPEELYQSALKEDALQIYANNSRLLDVKKSFEAKYSGLIVEVTDIRTYEIQRILRENHVNSDYTCDIVLCEDNNGVLTHELIAKGVLYKYVPWDISDKIKPEHNQEVLNFIVEAEVASYNNKQRNVPPIYNWWQLTENEFYGKIYLNDPLKSTPINTLFQTFIKESDEMAEAYESLYGKPLLVSEGSNAGKEFISMLMYNGVILTNSSDEASAAIGIPGQNNDAIGVFVSSKARMNEIGYHIAPIFQLEPFAGISMTNSVMMVSGAKNINSAKLFIRFLLGEADGKGDGIKPYLTEGIWPVRKDVEPVEKMKLEEVNLLHIDKEYVYNNRENFRDFWLSVLENIEKQ